MIDFMALVPNIDDLDESHDKRVAEFDALQDAKRELATSDALRRTLVEHGCPVKDLDRALGGECITTSALRNAQEAHQRDEKLLTLSGRPGCGKTTAAAWWLVQGRDNLSHLSTSSARFVDATTLARWPKYDETRMRQLTRARALVIDDLGVEYADKNGAFSSMLDEVINSRYSSELPTLITTNLTGLVFKERYGERIADRIRECGRYVEISDGSMRGAR